MNKLLEKYFLPFVILCIVIVVTYVGSLIQYNYQQQQQLEEIGTFLETGSTISEIAKAIPAHFEIGSSREKVMEKIYEIFPDIDANSNNHGFWECNSRGCVDYVSFYDGTVGLELTFRFRYDDSGNLSAIEYAPGS